MAIITIVKMTDQDTPLVKDTLTPRLGMIVTRPASKSLPVPAMYESDPARYPRYAHAVVVQTSPLTVVSEDGAMIWRSSIEGMKFNEVGFCKSALLAELTERIDDLL